MNWKNKMDHKKAIKIGFSCLILCLMGLCFVEFAVAEDGVPGYYDWRWYATSHIGKYTTANFISSKRW